MDEQEIASRLAALEASVHASWQHIQEALVHQQQDPQAADPYLALIAALSEHAPMVADWANYLEVSSPAHIWAMILQRSHST